MDYININGEEIKIKEGVTKEKLKELGIIENDNPFDIRNGETAYYINHWLDVRKSTYFDIEDKDNEMICPCKDKNLVEERAKEERLSRLLWRFAHENNLASTIKEIENKDIEKWYIIYDIDKRMYHSNYYFNYGMPLQSTLFTSKETCELAIKQIVVPFMEGRL